MLVRFTEKNYVHRMGIYYHFYAQFRRDGEWVVPAEYKETLDDSERERNLGYFAWFKASDSGFARVFAGESPIIPLSPELPEGIRSTELFKQYEWTWDEGYVGHLGLGEFMLDSWPDTYLHVSRHVETRLVSVFTDGNQPFPETRLRQVGVPEAEIHEMTWWRRGIVDGPIRASRRRSEVTEVSWKESLAQIFSEQCYKPLLHLRNFGEDGDIRVICRRG